MSEPVNELLILQGGAKVPAAVTAQLATDSTGKIIASVRGTVSWTTASLAGLATENDDVAIYKACRAMKLVTSQAARVRAYATSAYRTADASRLATVDPTGDHGCQLEVITTASMLSVTLAPVADLTNMDGTPATTIYWQVQNLGATGAITVTVTVQQEE